MSRKIKTIYKEEPYLYKIHWWNPLYVVWNVRYNPYRYDWLIIRNETVWMKSNPGNSYSKLIAFQNNPNIWHETASESSL
jgi:hypothetical protein